MENYKILEFIDEGPQSYVYLVEGKKDGKKYILKQIECNDITEAKKACKEALNLKHLKHYNISNCKDAFTHWNDGTSAILVCLVLEFYELGNIEKYIGKQRSKQEPVDETVINRWLGQFVDALVYLQKNSICHMNIKPTNIFLKKNNDLSLDDFGIFTILNESRSYRKRQTDECIKCMAPEGLRRSFNASFDLWGVGCIILDLMTCHILTKREITSILHNIKLKSRKYTEQIINRVSSIYSTALCEITGLLLDKNPDSRMSPRELIESPLVIEYFKSKISISLDETIDEKAKELKNDEEIVPEIPEGQGIEALVIYMKMNISKPLSLINAMKYMYYNIDEDVEVDNDTKDLIGKIMLKHKDVENIQIIGCILFAKLAKKASQYDVLFSRKLISPISLAMKTYPCSIKLQIAGTILYKTLAIDQRAAEIIGGLGGVQDTMKALRAFPNHAEVITNCCGALSTLASHPINAKTICKEDGIKIICKTLEDHLKLPGLAEAACAALWVVCSEICVDETLGEERPVKLILSSIETHVSNASVVHKAFMALASLIECDESSAYEVLYGESDVTGFTTLINAFNHHKSNENITEGFAKCIAELSKYDDLCTELNLTNVHTLLTDVRLRFSDKKNTLLQIDDTLKIMARKNDDDLERKAVKADRSFAFDYN